MKPSPKSARPGAVESASDRPKLHKALAQSGLGSRLDMESAIREGRVTVEGQVAQIGQRLAIGERVQIDGKTVNVAVTAPPVRVLAYHKPTGEVVTHDDPQNRPTVFDRLPRLRQAKWLAVGRLDINTEGLLLITNSGDLANRLMHPSYGLEREYAVRVLGALTDEEKDRLLTGVTIDGGRQAFFNSIEEDFGSSDRTSADENGAANRWYRVTIAEGRNREVRRMIEALNHAVSRLIRIRYGAMTLPRGLRRGAFVELPMQAISELGQAVGAPQEMLKGNRAPVRKPASRRADRGKSSGPRPDMNNPKHAKAARAPSYRAPEGDTARGWEGAIEPRRPAPARGARGARGASQKKATNPANGPKSSKNRAFMPSGNANSRSVARPAGARPLSASRKRSKD